jgi:hypothetical protein
MSLPLFGILFLTPLTSISFVGIVYLFSGLLIVVGMACAPWRTRLSFVLVLLGSALALVTITARILFAENDSGLRILTLPSQSGPRLLNRIFNEQDIVLLSARFGPFAGFISPTEAQSLIPAFSSTFREMRQFGATSLSPFLTTYLGQEHPNNFDLVVAEPASAITPRSGIIFLHGYGGNFTVQCWLVAKAGYWIDAITVCPSTSPSGQWWNTRSQSILQETIAYLRQRGVERIYLAGLSNGAIGASRLADQFQKDLTGLILISGADPNAVITELSTLVIQGRSDERIPVAMIERYVMIAPQKTTYRLFEGDHFVLLKQADQVQEAIGNWLIEQESSSEQK